MLRDPSIAQDQKQENRQSQESKQSNKETIHNPSLAMSEVEETLERIKSHKGVQAVLIVNSDGIPIRPSKGMDDDLTHKYSASISQLAIKARSVIRDLDPLNDLTFLRIRSKKHEIMVAPGESTTAKRNLHHNERQLRDHRSSRHSQQLTVFASTHRAAILRCCAFRCAQTRTTCWSSFKIRQSATRSEHTIEQRTNLNSRQGSLAQSISAPQFYNSN